MDIRGKGLDTGDHDTDDDEEEEEKKDKPAAIATILSHTPNTSEVPCVGGLAAFLAKFSYGAENFW